MYHSHIKFIIAILMNILIYFLVNINLNTEEAGTQHDRILC